MHLWDITFTRFDKNWIYLMTRQICIQSIAKIFYDPTNLYTTHCTWQICIQSIAKVFTSLLTWVSFTRGSRSLCLSITWKVFNIQLYTMIYNGIQLYMHTTNKNYNVWPSTNTLHTFCVISPRSVWMFVNNIIKAGFKRELSVPLSRIFCLCSLVSKFNGYFTIS